MITKSFTIAELKVNDDDRTFEGYASTFGNIDRGGDIVVSGAFLKTIKERFTDPKRSQIKILWQHYEPLGMPLEIREDEKGLWVKGRISKTRQGDDALTLMRDGVVDRMSIGFEIIKHEMDDETGIRRLTELRLYEFSPVTFPMNEAAVITGVKSLAELCIGGVPTTPEALRKMLEVSQMLGLAASSAPMYVKAATEFMNLPLSDRDLEWDAAAADARIREWAGADGDDLTDFDFDKYREAFFWFDANEPELLESYKLPFCDIVGGEKVAVWTGVTAAADVIQDGGDGVGIPDGDIAGVRVHIDEYYAKAREQFDDEDIIVPWAQDAAAHEDDEDDEDDKGEDDTKSGRVLSQKNINALSEIAESMKTASESITALVKNAQPSSDTGNDDQPLIDDGGQPLDNTDIDSDTAKAIADMIATMDKAIENMKSELIH